MNYENATDAELEVKLAHLIGYEPSDMELLAGQMVSQLKRDPLIGRAIKDEKEFPCPDYCTDWNATMPLAVKYGLSLEPDAYEERGWWFSASRHTDFHARNESGEPLRAIVICLIEVLESKQ